MAFKHDYAKVNMEKDLSDEEELVLSTEEDEPPPIRLAVAGDVPLQRVESIRMIDVHFSEEEHHDVSSIWFNCTYPMCFNFCCKDYRIRVYLHYFLWQILVFCINITLIVLYAMSDTVVIDSGFLGVLFIFCAILLRDKHFLWFLYGFVKKSRYYTCSRQCRYHIARFADGIGGLHSSCGVAALMWNAIYFYHNQVTLGEINITWILPFSLLIMIIFALPCVRYQYHNTFELTHRYFRWLVVVLLIYSHIGVGEMFTLSILILILILTVYPWFIQHTIPGTEVKVVSAAMASAYFFPIKCPMGAVTKISTNRLEYHVFGITPMGTDEITGKPKSLVLIKSLGDWTTKLNEDTKNKKKLNDMTFYISRVKPPNFTQGLFNWDRVFILVVGVGIVPCLPYVTNDVSDLDLAVSLLWVARDHGNNYPKFIVDLVASLPNMELYDTTRKKRPNLCTLVVEKARDFEAQAVFIVSGAELSSRVGNYVYAQGIPVFASNFDT